MAWSMKVEMGLEGAGSDDFWLLKVVRRETMALRERDIERRIEDGEEEAFSGSLESF